MLISHDIDLDFAYIYMTCQRTHAPHAGPLRQPTDSCQRQWLLTVATQLQYNEEEYQGLQEHQSSGRRQTSCCIVPDSACAAARFKLRCHCRAAVLLCPCTPAILLSFFLGRYCTAFSCSERKVDSDAAQPIIALFLACLEPVPSKKILQDAVCLNLHPVFGILFNGQPLRLFPVLWLLFLGQLLRGIALKDRIDNFQCNCAPKELISSAGLHLKALVKVAARRVHWVEATRAVWEAEHSTWALQLQCVPSLWALRHRFT